MIYGSVIVNFLLWFSEVLRNSKTAKAANRVMNAFSFSLLGRACSGFFRRENNEERYAYGSYFYGALCGVWQGVLKALRFIIKPAAYAKDGSIIIALINGSRFLKFEVILFAFASFMFVVPHEYWNNAYGLLGAICLAAMYVLSLALGKSLGENMRGIWLSFILFAAAAALSVVVSRNRGDSIRVFMFFATSFLLCLLVYGTLTSIKRFDAFTAFVFSAVLITSLVGIYQKTIGVAIDASLTDVNLNIGMPGRVYSTLANPNNFAEYLVLFLPFCFAFILNQENTAKRLCLLGFILLPIAALMFTLSRSGWLSFGVSAVVFAAAYKPKRFIPLLILFLLFLPVLTPLMPSYVVSRFMTIGNLKDTSSAYRIEIWTGVLAMLEDHWISGTGLGPAAFKAIYPAYAEGLAAIAPHSHMLFMEVWAEMGILGFVTFSWLVLSLLGRSISVTRKRISKKVRNYACAAAASAFGIMVLGAAEYVWFYPRVMFAFFIAVGMGMAAVRLARAEAGEGT